jgi:drug efflux transport system ATP-binding protein
VSASTPEPIDAIRVRALVKRYGAIQAVRGVDLDVRTGEVFGLIGPDGAGKTSIFQILGGVMEPTSGTAELLGRPARQARPHVGYLTQAFSLYLDLSVDENLRYVGELRRVPRAEIERRGRRYLAMFGMERFAGRLAGRLSGGMKQKLALTCALVAEPRVLLLDEPTTGVDPVSRREFWDALAQLSSHGITILLATPYLDEAERCHRVALMHEGRIHRIGTPAELRRSLGLERLEVRADDLRRAETVLARLVAASFARPVGPSSGRPVIADVQRFGDRLDVMVRDVREGERVVREALSAAHLGVRGVRVAAPTLENTFVAILRDAEGQTPIADLPGSDDTIGPERAAADPSRRALDEHDWTVIAGSHGEIESRSDHEPVERHPHEAADRPGREHAGRAQAAVAIGARRLRKVFGEFEAVRSIDLHVRYGEVYGLLGANGAGKTTTIKMLCGLLEPSGGAVELAGERAHLRAESVRQQVGYMSQKFSLYDELTVEENLDFFAGVYGVSFAHRSERTRWVLEFSGLAGRGHELTGHLPGGWKQRVAFGAAIMHEPRVLFLDEPTSGVDPIARRAFWTAINRLADRGTAILVTTHYLEEAEQCNRLGFMVAGDLVAEGTPSGVKAAQGGRVIEVRAAEPERAVAALRAELPAWRVSLFGDRLHVIVDGDAATETARLAGRLAHAGITVLHVAEQEYSLEDVFIVLAQKNGRGAAAAA